MIIQRMIYVEQHARGSSLTVVGAGLHFLQTLLRIDALLLRCLPVPFHSLCLVLLHPFAHMIAITDADMRMAVTLHKASLPDPKPAASMSSAGKSKSVKFSKRRLVTGLSRIDQLVLRASIIVSKCVLVSGAV